jgi:SAM-dependent methyltransferase
MDIFIDKKDLIRISKILFSIFLILLLIVILKIYYPNFYNQIIGQNGIIERFEDKFQDYETYDEIYDSQFVDMYEIVYRDFTDIDNDLKIVNQKIVDPVKNKDELNFLVCGCGVGKLCKAIKNKNNNVIGIDISENMLKKAQILYPNIKFARGNLIKEKIFEKNSFSHIFLDEKTLYYNKPEEMNIILGNVNGWLKEGGFLVTHIYHPTELALACRYYSSNYIDNKGNVHGFTYLNDFSHDCYYIKDESEKNVFHYYDKLIFDTGDKKIKKTTLYIPEKEYVYDIILKNGFDIFYIEKERDNSIGGYELAIFRKKKNKTTVKDLEKNKL